MKFPELVPDIVCTTPITITIEGEGLDEDGAPVSAFHADLKCNYQDGGKTILTEEKKLIEISGTAYFNGDIAPDITNLTGGEAVINGEIRKIAQGFKRRNIDGTVNFTEVRFI